MVVLFPGRAESPAGQPALLAASLEALGTLDAFGVRPTTGVGYGLAEITGLAWAGCIPAAEAARLVAQCGQVLRACARGTAAMARVTADEDLARALGAPGRLHIAAYEGPRTHVLAGSTAGVRELTRRAGMLRVPVEVLDSAAPMHSPGMARCAAPLRSVLAATSFAPPRRRLVSTITGRLITPDDDLAWLLAAQVTRPVLFAQAMAQAAGAADLIVIAGPDAGLADRAAECGGVAAVAIPECPEPTASGERRSTGPRSRRGPRDPRTPGLTGPPWPRPSPRCSPPGRSPISRRTWARPGPPGPEARWPAGPCRGCGPRNRSPPRAPHRRPASAASPGWGKRRARERRSAGEV